MAKHGAKKRKQQPPDFRHVKAKVGKRALKPANETSTEANFATINVGRQKVGRGGDIAAIHELETKEKEVHDIFSTRGHSLDAIIVDLKHPAKNVRVSAARGLKDAVTRPQATTAVIQAHLALLIPVCGKCCIDEENEVRHLAQEILREILIKVCSKDPHSDNVAKLGQVYLKPFMKLLMAHIVSALNSLNRKAQVDGTSMVNMMSSIIPSLVAPFAADLLHSYSIIVSLLPPLKSKDGESTTKGTDSVKKKVLKSLLALLRSGEPKLHTGRGMARRRFLARPADLEIVERGRGIDSLFIKGGAASSTPSLGGLNSLAQLTAIGQEAQRIPISSGNICALLSNLRDAFAEATQADQENRDLQEILLILESAHLFKKASCLVGDESNRKDPLVKLWRQYTGLIMAMFPLLGGPYPSSLITEVNLMICILILDSHSDGMISDREHLDDVMAYLFGELENCRPSPSKLSPSEGNTLAKSEDALFSALHILLVISRDHKDAKSGAAIYHKLVKVVASSFFSSEMADTDLDFIDAKARSPTARKCVLLAKELFSQSSWSLDCFDSKGCGAGLCQILQGLSTLLGSWRSDFLLESNVVVTLLHSVVRRMESTTDKLLEEELTLVSHIKTSLLPLFKPTNKKSSTFEDFTIELQQKIIGLVVMLQSPPEGTLDGLSKSCARCWSRSTEDTVSPNMASYIMQAVHAVRKTIPVRTYLGFVTNSMGVSQKPFGKPPSQMEDVAVHDILRFDAGVELASQILRQCGPLKVLPLMQPLLAQWLALNPISVMSSNELLTARATVSILASLFSSFGRNEVMLRDVAPKLEKPVKTAICCILQHLPSSRGAQSSSQEELAAFLEPVILLFQKEDRLFRSCYMEVSSQIQELTVTGQTRLLSALTMMTKDARLFTVLQGSSDLVQCTIAVEEMLSKSSLEHAACLLRTSIEVGCAKVEVKL